MSATHSWSRPLSCMSARPVRHHRPGVPRVRRQRHEGPPAQTQQVVLAHQAQHALVVDDQAFIAKLPSDVPVAAVFPAVPQPRPRDGVGPRGIVLARRAGLPEAVMAGSADPRQPAEALDRDRALRQGARHRLDDFVDRAPPGAPLGRRVSFTCRKARRKKSRSTCCWPILRSSSATRRCAPASSSSPASHAAPWTATAVAPLRGRPHPRNAADPLCRTLSRHAYKSRPRNCRSRATSVTLSPAARRATAACFNAIGYSRCFVISSSPRETVPYFPCLIFGVHYNTAMRSRFSGIDIVPEVVRLCAMNPLSARHCRPREYG